MKIAIDAMGGDFAPLEIVLGALEAVRETEHIDVVLVGDKTQIFKILEDNNETNNPRISVYHASQVIGMDEHPGQALRKKKDASVVVATSLVRSKECEAVIAPGSTGAAVAAALFGLGRIKGIDRPVIATPMPTVNGITVMLDSGANSNSKPKHLVQGALMGSEYAPESSITVIQLTVGIGVAITGRSTPLMRPRPNKAAATAAPVLPGAITASQ